MIARRIVGRHRLMYPSASWVATYCVALAYMAFSVAYVGLRVTS